MHRFRWAVPVILFLLPCLLLWRVVFLNEVFLPVDLLRDLAPWKPPSVPAPVPWTPLMWDGVAEFYPWRLFAAQTLRAGWLPLWNPYQFCGTPFVANSQSAVFYPLNLLFVILPVTRAFGVSVLIHLTLTGWFMYGFLRSPALRLSRSAALLGAIVWQMSTWQTVWLALPTFLCVSAWLPLALRLTDRWVISSTVTRAAALGGCLGLMLLGGHLQIGLYCLLMVLAYGLFRLVPQLVSRQRQILPTLAGGLLIAGLMLGLAAPQLLPAIELSRMSHRAGGVADWAGYTGYVHLAVPAVNLVTLWLPGVFGSPTAGSYWGVGTNGGPSAYIENAAYIGIAALLLAIIGAALAWRTQSSVRFFAVAAIVVLLLALGTPLNALLYFGIPGFAQSGSPGRILVLWTWSAAVLAAVGLYRVQLSVEVKRLTAPTVTFIGLFVLAAAFAAIWIGQNAPAGTLATNLGNEHDLWRLPLGILLGAGAVFMLWRRGSVSTGGFGGLVAALVAVDLLAANIGFNRTARPGDVFPIVPAIAYLQQHAGDARIMPLNMRWGFYGAPPAILPPNSGMAYGLRDLQGYDSLLTGQYIAWAGQLDGGAPAPPENGNMVFTYGWSSPRAAEAAARYLVSRGPLDGAARPLKLVFQDDSTCIYENTSAAPRAQVNGSRDAATVVDEAPTRVAIYADIQRSDTGITLSDQWYPGWTATINGQPASIERAPEIFRTVSFASAARTTAPTHTVVTMRYQPESFRVGLYSACLALGVLAATSAGWGMRAVLGRGRSSG